MSDFELKPPRRRSRDEEDDDEDEVKPEESGSLNLFHLTVEFLGYLRLNEDVAYPKGELARKHIHRYILERHAGELKPGKSMFEEVMRPHRHRPKRKVKKHEPEHLLCPDRDTLDRYLARLLNFINPQFYEAAATLELIPAWLRFLETRRLIDTEQRSKTLSALRGLDQDLLKIFESSEPALRKSMEGWWENAQSEVQA